MRSTRNYRPFLSSRCLNLVRHLTIEREVACRPQHHISTSLIRLPANIRSPYRFHFAKTIHRMKAFSIGRIQQPWVNLTPPIRRGPIPTITAQEAEKATLPFTSIDLTLPISEPCCSLHPMDEKSGYTGSSDDGFSTICSYSSSDGADCKNRCVSGKIPKEMPAKFSRFDHTAILKQREVEQGLLSSPSIDLETQQNIARVYRALHEEVKVKGLYDCRFSEYGKEMIRYSLLFGLSMFLLLNRWYLTSAGVLGLFWVRVYWPRQRSNSFR